MYKLTAHGARGSAPVCGEQALRYGGDTTCFSLTTPDTMVIVDAGTGICSLGDRLAKQATRNILILFTHFHLDHLIGLPGFQPLYDPRSEITLFGDATHPAGWQETLGAFMRTPFWPVSLEALPARPAFDDLAPGGGPLRVGDAEIRWCPLNHPQGCLAFRIDGPQQSWAIVTDHECGDPAIDSRLRDFCDHVDVLVCDAHYTPKEYPAHRDCNRPPLCLVCAAY